VLRKFPFSSFLNCLRSSIYAETQTWKIKNNRWLLLDCHSQHFKHMIHIHDDGLTSLHECSFSWMPLGFSVRPRYGFFACHAAFSSQGSFSPCPRVNAEAMLDMIFDG
jgi:hypothetical protein